MTNTTPNLKEQVLALLPGEKPEAEEQFAAYCLRILTELDKDKVLKNPWMKFKTPQALVVLYKRVEKEGIPFDGKHVTLQNTWVSYDYVALKNKMLLAYPESKVDIELVYKWDEFSFQKVNGEIIYHHNIEKPFGHKDDEIVGGYCVIKNRRGEFLTTMSMEEIDKHKAVAKTDTFWKKWKPQMCKKTIIKQGCSTHFRDIYENILDMDNEENDPSLLDERTVLAKAQRETAKEVNLDTILK